MIIYQYLQSIIIENAASYSICSL